MSQTRTRNLFLLTCFVLPFLMGISAFSSKESVHEMSNADVSSKGFGIMGDSNSDEYQADDHRGGEYASTTLGWMEQLVKQRGLNFGPWGTWGEPRRTGYEYNWARSGATAESLIRDGQHTGLAKQIAEGKVSYVFLWVGNNDFHFTNGSYKEIYDGSLSDEALQQKVESVVANIALAVDTVLAAGPVDIVMVNMRDIGAAPIVQEQFPDAAGRQRVTDAIQSINQQLEAMATKRHIKIVGADDFTRSLLARVDKKGNLSIGNELINMLGTGDEPHNGRLGDPAGHSGTVVSGLTANFLFVEPFNSQYDTNIAPLTDSEILGDAGLTAGGSNTILNTPVSGTSLFNMIRSSVRKVLSSRLSGSLSMITVGVVLILMFAIGFLKLRRH